MRQAREIGLHVADLTRFMYLLAVYHAAVVSELAMQSPAGIRVQGPSFACCNQSVWQMQSLFADQSVIAFLNQLHAEVAIATLDFAPARTDVVHRLNQAGIPVIAWIVLSKQEGYYLDANNASAAAARVAAFEKWTADNGLEWVAVGE